MTGWDIKRNGNSRDELSELKGIILCVVLIVQFEVAAWMFARRKKAGLFRSTARYAAAFTLSGFLIGLGFALLYGAYYLIHSFGDVRLEELIYHLKAPLGGTNVSTFGKLFWAVGGIAVGTAAFTVCAGLFFRKKQGQRSYTLWMGTTGLILCVYALWIVGEHIDVSSYWSFIHDKTTLYEDYYVDGRDIALTFPEKKRNLIYIYVESMETTYADQESGGAMKKNYIPELTELASEGIDFSGSAYTMNGAHTLSGTTYTMGGLAAQTSGVPINPNLLSNESVNENDMEEYSNDYLLSGAWTLGDILAEQGYTQEFCIGSEGGFGGRSSYFTGHGNYKIWDYNTAIEKERIPKDYRVWWGYEDEKLFAYAKDELLSLAKAQEPFNFTMLTADTHFTDGYFCRLCENTDKEQYNNVISCASRQIKSFVDWISQQDFYENTTIIIAGDHLTMDSSYMDRMHVKDFDRKTYVTILNPADGCKEPDDRREYSTLDLYPTTLAALGVQIEGDRLGMGVNLFSAQSTLCEEYGIEALDAELLKNSDLYLNQLLH